MLRLIAGFLFAIVVIVVGHFGAWLLAAHHAQDEFITAIENTPQLTLSHGKIEKSGYPREIQIKVHDLTLRWDDPNAAKAATLHLPHIRLQTPLFDMRKTIVSLNRQFELELQHNKKETQHFRVVAEGARFSSFIRPDNTTEHGFNMHNLTIWDNNRPRSAGPVVQTGVGYVVREVPGLSSPVAWRISVEKAKISPAISDTPFKLNRLVAVLGFRKDFFSQYKAELLQAFSAVPATREKAKQELAKKISQTTFSPHMLIDSMQIEQDNNWVSLRGSLGLNNQQYLDGRLSLNANHLTQVVNFIEKMGLIKSPNALTKRTLNKDLEDGKDNSMAIIFERDRAYINHQYMTSTPTLNEFLKQDE